MKKIISLLLVLALFPVMIVSATEEGAVQTEEVTVETKEEPVVGTPFYGAQKLLEYLEIGDKETYEQETVTRAQFAKIIAQAVCNNISEPDKQIYSDVSTGNSYYPYIYELAVMNIMNGYDSSAFKPNENISMEEAYAACINALGYRPIVDLSGGFFKGYRSMVERIDLDDGLKKASGQITGSEAAILIYNMLNTNTADLINDGVGRTLLDINFDMKGYIGNISQIGGVAVSTQISSISEDSIIIDGIAYKIRKSYGEKISEYVGCSVEFYVRDEDDDAEVVLVYPNKEIKSITVMWDEITNVTVTSGAITVEYYNDDENRSRKIRMEKGASLILNDRAAPINENEFDMPNTKTVFMDTDRDGEYEIARVSRYNNMIVSAIDTVNGVVYGKYDVYKSEELLSNEYEVKIIQNGTTVGMRNIKAGDILSIYVGGQGDNTKKTVIINNDKTVAGQLTSVTEDGYIVDDIEYYPAYCFTKAVDEGFVRMPKAGENVTLCLDVEGYIAEIKYGQSDTVYAFIVSAKALDDSFIEDSNFSLHVFTEEGEWKDYELEEKKVYFNDVKMTPYEVVMNNLKNSDGIIYQLLKLKLNAEEKVARIYTAQIPIDDDDAEKKYINGVFTRSHKPLNRYYSNKGGADIMFAENPATPNWGYGEVEDAKVDFAVTPSIKVMRIPPKNSTSETMKKEDLYSVGTGAMFPRWEWAYTIGYDGDRFGTPGILVWYQPEGKESDILMVNKIGQMLNETTEEIESYIEVMSSTGTIKYRSEKHELFSNLSKGDIIKVKCDMADVNKRHVTAVTKYSPSQLNNGTVVGVSNGMIRILPEGESKSVLYAITAQQGPCFSDGYIEYLNTASLSKGKKIVYNEYYGAIRSYIIVN